MPPFFGLCLLVRDGESEVGGIGGVTGLRHNLPL
jgi:hypothetical protein